MKESIGTPSISATTKPEHDNVVRLPVTNRMEAGLAAVRNISALFPSPPPAPITFSDSIELALMALNAASRHLLNASKQAPTEAAIPQALALHINVQQLAALIRVQLGAGACS